MNKSLLDGISEEELFTILAHPLRRKILYYINEFNQISFTQMSKEWKISTGTIYHHLKILDKLITKNETQLYELTEIGTLISNWYIVDEEGKATIAKIDAVTYFGNPTITLLEKYWTFTLALSVILIFVALPKLTSFKMVVLGSFLFLDNNNSISSSYVAVNFLIIFLFLIIYLAIYFVITQNSVIDPKLVNIYLLQYWPNYLFIILFFNNESNIPNSEVLFILALFSQLMYLVLNTSFLVITKNITVERSVIHSIITLYAYLMINTLAFNP